MEDLVLTPFTQKELEKEYSTNTFTERGINFTLLRESDKNRPQSGNLYKFGLVDDDYNFYWFFMSRVIARNRLDALKTFYNLSIYCDKKQIGQPFAYKVSK